MKRIETNRLILREFKESDVKGCFVHFGQDKELGRFLPMYPVENEYAMKELICGFIKAYDMGAYIWLIEEKNSQEPIGYVTVDVPYRQLGVGEIGYLLGEKYQGKGYAKEAVQAVITFMFQKEGLYLIEAKYNENNCASGKLLERLHFVKEGVLRDRRIDFQTQERCSLVICSLKKEEHEVVG